MTCAAGHGPAVKSGQAQEHSARMFCCCYPAMLHFILELDGTMEQAHEQGRYTEEREIFTF